MTTRPRLSLMAAGGGMLALLLLAGTVACDSGPLARGQRSPVGTEAEGETQTVPIRVQQIPGGGVLAFVNVTIQGQGPYEFALDTGASNSVLDRGIADQLGLSAQGTADTVAGVQATGSAALTRVDDWQLGDVPLSEGRIILLDLPEIPGTVTIDGLLGSDVLSRFGAILVDYERGHLVLRPQR